MFIFQRRAIVEYDIARRPGLFVAYGTLCDAKPSERSVSLGEQKSDQRAGAPWCIGRELQDQAA
jgi:hypothetical protein